MRLKIALMCLMLVGLTACQTETTAPQLNSNNIGFTNLSGSFDREGSKSVTYGPITSGSEDSGTCGNTWANDTYKRVFVVNSASPYTLTEKFVDGKFVTVAGPGPGACNTPTNTGAMLGAGVHGEFEGDFKVVVTGGLYNSRAVCTQVTCATTRAFVATVYGPSASYDVPSFAFNYKAGKNGKWQNASADRGGNKGDITGLARKGEGENDDDHDR
jgi:hypothetical protein